MRCLTSMAGSLARLSFQIHMVTSQCQQKSQGSASCHLTTCHLTYRAPHVDGLVRLLLRGCSRHLEQHVLFLFGCVYEDNVADKHPGKAPKAEEEKVDERTDLVDR